MSHSDLSTSQAAEIEQDGRVPVKASAKFIDRALAESFRQDYSYKVV
jgi:hypothetical protein